MSSQAHTTTSSDKTKLNTIMREIEKKTEKKVIELQNNTAHRHISIGVADNKDKMKADADSLAAIMLSGANEFKEKTGRHMTYGEMREMYG